MAAAGNPNRLLPFPEKYQAMFSSGLLVHNDTIANNPKLIEGLGRAIAKSTFACGVAPRACTRGYWQLNRALKPSSENEKAWIDKNMREAMIDQQTFEYFPAGETKEWGKFPKPAWTQQAKIIGELLQIDGSSLPVEQLYTNNFVPAFNNFDAKKVVEMAKARESALE